jgi:predicted Holliday junction resolvase-like endonuclease
VLDKIKIWCIAAAGIIALYFRNKYLKKKVESLETEVYVLEKENEITEDMEVGQAKHKEEAEIKMAEKKTAKYYRDNVL